MNNTCNMFPRTSAAQFFHSIPTKFDETLQKARLVRLPVAKRHIELYEGNLEDIPMEFVPKHLTSNWESLLGRAQRSKRAVESFVKKENKAWAPIMKVEEREQIPVDNVRLTIKLLACRVMPRVGVPARKRGTRKENG